MNKTDQTETERMEGFNRTERPFPDQAILQELFEEQVSQRPLQAAVLCDHDKFWGVASLDFRQLNERANQIAHLLRSLGAGPNQVVGILAERSFAMIIGIFG